VGVAAEAEVGDEAALKEVEEVAQDSTTTEK